VKTDTYKTDTYKERPGQRRFPYTPFYEQHLWEPLPFGMADGKIGGGERRWEWGEIRLL